MGEIQWRYGMEDSKTAWPGGLRLHNWLHQRCQADLPSDDCCLQEAGGGGHIPTITCTPFTRMTKTSPMASPARFQGLVSPFKKKKGFFQRDKWNISFCLGLIFYFVLFLIWLTGLYYIFFLCFSESFCIKSQIDAFLHKPCDQIYCCLLFQDWLL